jgi:hypothetical protein
VGCPRVEDETRSCFAKAALAEQQCLHLPPYRYLARYSVIGVQVVESNLTLHFGFDGRKAGPLFTTSQVIIYVQSYSILLRHEHEHALFLGPSNYSSDCIQTITSFLLLPLLLLHNDNSLWHRNYYTLDNHIIPREIWLPTKTLKRAKRHSTRTVSRHPVSSSWNILFQYKLLGA